MTTDAMYRALFDSELEVDEADLKAMVRRGEVVVDDHDVALLGHRNRVALALGPVERVTGAPVPELAPGLARWDISLLCVLHPSPGCTFRRARLTVDLRPTASAIVRDMSPREVQGDQPLEITTTVEAGLKFAVIPSVLEVDARRERASTHNVHEPTVVTSGKGFSRAFWDFRAGDGARLQPDREMRLLVDAPDGAPLLARFNLTATVAVDGAAQLVPLLRRRAEIDQTYRLA
ncbi:hypothetical protein [Streptomyces sp. NBC_00582]|uniref:hypothetical protein n=1 Tax=Streptomyces sp. NBC_00582 TaxID=2975783 RepID=UPI002E818866|nr:hypothetical protein [Streptomyces sp. NBC_00582]WUB67068.1 hypothetical protein OG852_45030 [Streptomyces sp. NBC_00582]